MKDKIRDRKRLDEARMSPDEIKRAEDEMAEKKERAKRTWGHLINMKRGEEPKKETPKEVPADPKSRFQNLFRK